MFARNLVVFVVILGIAFGYNFPAEARLKQRPSETCRNLDMDNAEAVIQCLKSDHKYDQVIRHQFNERVSCLKMQDIVLKRYIVSTDPSLENKMSSKQRRGDDELPRPSCEVISTVTQTISDKTPMWDRCTGYGQASDKFEHFKACMIGYVRGYHRYQDDDVAKSTLSSYTCETALKSYEGVFKYTHRIFFDDQNIGKYTPEGYVAPSCDQIDSWLEELKGVKEQYNQQMAENKAAEQSAFKQLREEKRAAKAEAAKQRAIRAQNTRDAFAAIDQNYEDFYDEMDAKRYGGKSVAEYYASIEQPKDKIENKHVRRAIIQEIQALSPEQTNEFAGFKGVTKHTSGGIKSRVTNIPSAPKIFYGVDNAKIENCNIKGDKATCKYNVTFFTNVDNSSVVGNQRASLDALYKFVGAGPRTVIFENDFTHNGTQWKALLNEKQKKLLFPPPPPKSNQSDQDKITCDVMSAMGVPMLC